MKFYVVCLVAALLGTALAWGQPGDGSRGRTETEEGVEVLTRGPVHEAFAETVTFDPEPGLVAPKTPPAAIEEVPPDQRPEGANVAWIHGYWAWDDERTDFLWVSGIWRALPPGRQWVPGYWGRAGQGTQWTSGYWADAKASEVEYLPEPPATVEVGPNVTAPSADHIWLPGCWLWQQNRYAWRPGFWAAGHSDWDWVPAHYVWTPRGYVFVGGYYDYSVARRGVLFAPVYFSSSLYSQRGFSYSPATVINPAVFASHLFLRPGYGHYYFGDYYGSNYSSSGFSPWFSFHSSRHGYDPFYAQQRWQHRGDDQWDRHVEADFARRRDHEEARPPRTFAAQQQLGRKDLTGQDQGQVFAQPLQQYIKAQDGPVRFRAVAQQERQTVAQHGQEIQRLRQERQQLEAKAAVSSTANPSQQPEPARLKLSRSPIVARSADQLGRDQAPPKRHEVLKPALRAQPNPTPRAQPKPRPEVAPKPRPRAQPKPRSEVAPKPSPRAQPKPRSEVAPKPTPRAQPKPPRKVQPKDKDKGKN